MKKKNGFALNHDINLHIYVFCVKRQANNYFLSTTTYLYNFDILKLHCYIVKLRFAGGIHFFIEAVLTSTRNVCFEQKYEGFFYLKMFIFWW